LHVCFEGSWLPENSDPTDRRHGVREQFDALADQLRSDDWPREASDELSPHWIANTSRDDRDSPGRL